jgi:hypothetical protein
VNGTTVSSPSTSLQRSDSSQPMLLRVVGSQTSESMGKCLKYSRFYLLRSGKGTMILAKLSNTSSWTGHYHKCFRVYSDTSPKRASLSVI